MHKVLFLPFLQMPSGHHHAADCIKVQLEQNQLNFHCEKIDILSYGYGNLENLISSIYLHWIHTLPKFYSTIYRIAAVQSPKLNKRFRAYEILFLRVLKDVLNEKNPDLVICTHALPSYMLSRLKKLSLWSGPIINVYTDFFINNLWGIEEVDFHFVPSKKMKEKLLEQGIKGQQIFITGIPIYPLFKQENHKIKNEENFSALLCGGNMGTGSISSLLNRVNPAGIIHYKVLCGKNDKLYQYIEKLDNPHITPLRYISSKKAMNLLYDETDIIITKPGGVTISESLAKKIPVFVYDALPGQEEQNLHFLKQEGLIHHLSDWKSQENIEEEILNVLRFKKHEIISAIEGYLTEIELEDPVPLIIRAMERNTK